MDLEQAFNSSFKIKLSTRDWSISSLRSLSSLLLPHRAPQNLFWPCSSLRALYGLTRASKWILRDTKMTLAPMLLLENHPIHLNPAHYISEIIREGTKNGTAFFKCHGHEQFEMTGLDPEYNRLFNEGMVCTARVVGEAGIWRTMFGWGSSCGDGSLRWSRGPRWVSPSQSSCPG